MGSADLRHRLIAEVKKIASELGKIPTREEFRQHTKIGERSYQKAFGGFALLLQAAGLRPGPDRFNPDDLFRVPVEKPLVSQDHTIVPKTGTHDPKFGSSKKILVLGDLHFPWANVDALCAVYLYIKQNPQIDTVIQVGDLYDLYSWAKFPRSHCLYDPQTEIKIAREMASEMWATIRSLLPHARCVQLLGNHDIRPIKRAMELAPELEPFLEFKKFFEFEGVQLIEDPREPLELGGVLFMHGYLSGLGAHARKFLRSVVCGHTHKGGVVTVAMSSADNREPQNIFELNAGYLGNALSRPMSYTPVRINEWTLGFGYIDEWGPRFISL